ncbi:hypothetical protein CEXT_766051 [Caerostris extrusa]|uniref:Uncharacterized protein n=1 Tax=Caerostris extrusa TaxID=172846 RepID=A0AAV4NI38_CAEEX|nr:hypothetical protein CEXT_766051 [Caerostris extrusa]
MSMQVTLSNKKEEKLRVRCISPSTLFVKRRNLVTQRVSRNLSGHPEFGPFLCIENGKKRPELKDSGLNNWHVFIIFGRRRQHFRVEYTSSVKENIKWTLNLE